MIFERTEKVTNCTYFTIALGVLLYVLSSEIYQIQKRAFRERDDERDEGEIQ